MSNALTLVEERGGAVAELRFSQDQLALLKTTIAKGTDDNQFALFCEVAQRTGLNPFAKQIYAVIRNTKDGDKWVKTMTIQTGVDGYRLIAQRTGEYAGQRGPQWCGEDAAWRDVWLAKTPPSAARVGVFRTGFVEPVWGVATLSSYQQTDKEGKPSGLWRSMPDVMIAKCAEVLALRKAFPQELSGLYADEEMSQADNDDPITRNPRPANQAPPKRNRGNQPPPPIRQPHEQPFGHEDEDVIDGESRPVDTETGEIPFTWTANDLNDVLKKRAIALADLSGFLGAECNKETFPDLIDAWLVANPGATLETMADAAIEFAMNGTPQQAPLT